MPDYANAIHNAAAVQHCTLQKSKKNSRVVYECSANSGACDRPDLLVQKKRDDFYITATGCEVGFTPQGLQAAGAGGL
jgi:hypothetical protein